MNVSCWRFSMAQCRRFSCLWQFSIRLCSSVIYGLSLTFFFIYQIDTCRLYYSSSFFTLFSASSSSFPAISNYFSRKPLTYLTSCYVFMETVLKRFFCDITKSLVLISALNFTFAYSNSFWASVVDLFLISAKCLRDCLSPSSTAFLTLISKSSSSSFLTASSMSIISSNSLSNFSSSTGSAISTSGVISQNLCLSLRNCRCQAFQGCWRNRSST